ncbi:MAG: sugar phosphate isomerase/epimerase [Ginsengibacter sp.]
MINRKKFIQQTTLALTGSLSIPLITKASTGASSAKNESKLKVGIAGYTFLHFDVEKSIDMMKRLDLHYISLKDFHLPIDSDDTKIKSVMGQFENANIKVYAVGVIYMKTKQAVDDAFNYAKKTGVDMIVGVPTYDLLDYTEEKVKTSNIKIAIHNHGPEDALYPAPENVYEHIKNRDSRMGLCLDIGHATRAGADLEKVVLNYKARLFDMHIKDVTGAYKDGKAIETGRGIIDFKALIKALNKIDYKGVCSIEYEKDMTDPLPGIAESVGFFKGVIQGAC